MRSQLATLKNPEMILRIDDVIASSGKGDADMGGMDPAAMGGMPPMM